MMRLQEKSINTPNHIVIVDDEPIIRTLIKGSLEGEFPHISEAGSASELERILSKSPVDVVLLDIMLPDKDGFTLTRELRSRSNIGIIIISNKGDDYDRIIGLEMGADDYLCKPFVPRELLARVKTVMRRIQNGGESNDLSAIVRFEDWQFDLNARTLTDDTGESVRLTSGEFLILGCLIQKPGLIIKRSRLSSIIGMDSDKGSERSVDVLISRLRRKLKDNPRDPKYIVTVHGEGYIFAPQLY